MDIDNFTKYEKLNGTDYYNMLSDYPCDKCQGKHVWFREIDDIHGDIRWKCFDCGASGVSEGPDY